ncbi:hypothetical protein [Trinickia dinghuensis]|uniref:hypothetical protein n=1 Tax=Trinickia dinghuensis TaxID=2291023 RepID=UPI0011C070F7|nr:hypothetical protein [Trinickia dinghuensis]
MSALDSFDLATQFFVNLKSNTSSAVTMRMRAGNFTNGNPGATPFTVGLFDFSGKLKPLDFTSDFGSFGDSAPAFYVPSGTQLANIKIMGSSIPSVNLDYSMLVTPASGSSSVNLIMGFYVWSSDGVTDQTSGGFTVDLFGYDWSAGATSSCVVQISNSSDDDCLQTISKSSNSQGVFLPWGKTNK